jgi:hypothetical protein
MGGEWTEEDDGSDDDVPDNQSEELVYEDDEELQRLTKTNTEFNTNNGNLLGDPTANIKRSFAALKLGAPQKDSAGKKQTLKINVTPFGGNSVTSSAAPSEKKSKNSSSDSKSSLSSSLSDKKSEKLKNDNNGIVLKSITQTSNDFCTPSSTRDEVDKSPDYDVKITSSSEKSLLEEISETLLSKKIMVNEAPPTSTSSSTSTSANATALPIKVVEMTPKNDVIKVRHLHTASRQLRFNCSDDHFFLTG